MLFRAPIEVDLQLQALRNLRNSEVDRVKVCDVIIARVNQELLRLAQEHAKTLADPSSLMFDPNTLEFSRKDDATLEVDEVEVVEEAS